MSNGIYARLSDIFGTFVREKVVFLRFVVEILGDFNKVEVS